MKFHYRYHSKDEWFELTNEELIKLTPGDLLSIFSVTQDICVNNAYIEALSMNTTETGYLKPYASDDDIDEYRYLYYDMSEDNYQPL